LLEFPLLQLLVELAEVTAGLLQQRFVGIEFDQF
jgi:hypothetical protein